jgi:hypothetical protein
VAGQHHAPAALPLEKTLYLLYIRQGGSPSRSGWARKTSCTLEFDPRAFHTVDTTYTILSFIMKRHLLESCPAHWLSSRRFFVVLPQYRRKRRYIMLYAAKVQVRQAPVIQPIDTIGLIWGTDRVVK